MCRFESSECGSSALLVKYSSRNWRNAAAAGVNLVSRRVKTATRRGTMGRSSARDLTRTLGETSRALSGSGATPRPAATMLTAISAVLLNLYFKGARGSADEAIEAAKHAEA